MYTAVRHVHVEDDGRCQRFHAEHLVGDEIVTRQQWTDAMLCRTVILQIHNVTKERVVQNQEGRS